METYYSKNREKMNARHKQYYYDNKERILQERKQYYLENREQIKEKIKERIKNAEKKRQDWRKYYNSHKEELKEKRKAKRYSNYEQIKNYNIKGSYFPTYILKSKEILETRVFTKKDMEYIQQMSNFKYPSLEQNKNIELQKYNIKEKYEKV